MRELGVVGWAVVVLILYLLIRSWADELRRRDPPDERRDLW